MIKNGIFENESGEVFYFLNDKFHREDGPAIKFQDGGERWYQHDKLHRVDGPAVTNSKWKCWVINDMYHREDGPLSNSLMEQKNGMSKDQKLMLRIMKSF